MTFQSCVTLNLTVPVTSPRMSKSPVTAHDEKQIARLRGDGPTAGCFGFLWGIEWGCLVLLYRGRAPDPVVEAYKQAGGANDF